MYSNENKNGFSILDLLVKIIFAGLFIFILVWLFQKKVPNMKPFYSNVFRENIKYMEEAGESYFTDDLMPKEVGETAKISLSDMYSKKLLLPFVDEDGNSCNQYDSYVSITKLEEGYELKTNLVCNKESNYTVKTLGCHNYCPNNICNVAQEEKTEKVCSYEKIKQYQYKKLVSSTSTKYSCASGYTLKGKYCYKNVVSDTKSAAKTTTTSRTVTVASKQTVNNGTKTLVSTVVNNRKSYVDSIETTVPGKTETKQVAYSCQKTRTEKKCTTTQKQVPYSCQKTKTEKKCTTTTHSEAYSCNCTSHVGPTGKMQTTCSTCYRSVPVESCSNVEVPYTTTCYRTEDAQNCTDVQVPYTTTCYKNETTTTPATTSYSCPSGTTPEGSGASLKCYKTVKEYSCPSNSNYHEGNGASLKCYVVTNGSVSYSCADSSYKLSADKKTCSKVVNETSTEYKCDSGYKLEGKSCVKYTEEKKKATAKKITTKKYTYKWSSKSSLSGWKKTGKTRTVNGKKICTDEASL